MVKEIALNIKEKNSVCKQIDANFINILTLHIKQKLHCDGFQ